jgi:hypothetical protein
MDEQQELRLRLLLLLLLLDEREQVSTPRSAGGA